MQGLVDEVHSFRVVREDVDQSVAVAHAEALLYCLEKLNLAGGLQVNFNNSITITIRRIMTV